MARLQLVPTLPIGMAVIEFDVTRSLSDELTAQVATHPVEGGEAIADEVLIEPRQIEVEVVFSDIAPGITALSGPSRAEKKIADLRRVLTSKAISVLVDPESAVSRLVLRKVSVQRDRSTGRARAASLGFQQVKVIALELVAATGDADLEALGALGSVDLGLPPP